MKVAGPPSSNVKTNTQPQVKSAAPTQQAQPVAQQAAVKQAPAKQSQSAKANLARPKAEYSRESVSSTISDMTQVFDINALKKEAGKSAVVDELAEYAADVNKLYEDGYALLDKMDSTAVAQAYAIQLVKMLQQKPDDPKNDFCIQTFKSKRFISNVSRIIDRVGTKKTIAILSNLDPADEEQMNKLFGLQE